MAKCITVSIFDFYLGGGVWFDDSLFSLIVFWRGIPLESPPKTSQYHEDNPTFLYDENSK